MRFWANLLGYQLVWFSAVIGAGRGLAWPGVTVALAFIAAQLAFSREWQADLKLAGAALLCGCLLDGALSALGWSVYAASAWPAPHWILALWAAFALTLNHSLAYLRPRPWLACVFGAIGGPLAYWGAARGWSGQAARAPSRPPAPPWRAMRARRTARPANRARRWQREAT